MMAILMVQIVVLVVSCAVHSCWVKEYEELELEREASAKKRNRRMAKVQEEAMAEINKEKKELDDDKVMRSKYAQCRWVKTDFEP